MKNFVRFIVVPTLIAGVLSVLWGLAVFFGWRAIALSSEMLARRGVSSGAGNDAGRNTARMLAQVEDVVAQAIMAGTAALFLVCLAWFVACTLRKVTGASVRKQLRGTWLLTFLVNFLIVFGVFYYMAMVQGNLGARITSSALLVQGAIILVLFFLGYWIVTAVATNKTFRPAIPPF